MKKIALSILAVVLMATLVCGSAFALTGDLTTKSVKAYADSNFTNCVGTIPKYTSLLVRAYGSYADVICNGVQCFIDPSALAHGKYDDKYIATATLKKGVTVYQRPSTSSNSVTCKKARKVYVCAKKDGIALVRTKGGIFGFVPVKSLSDINPR